MVVSPSQRIHGSHPGTILLSRPGNPRISIWPCRLRFYYALVIQYRYMEHDPFTDYFYLLNLWWFLHCIPAGYVSLPEGNLYWLSIYQWGFYPDSSKTRRHLILGSACTSTWAPKNIGPNWERTAPDLLRLHGTWSISQVVPLGNAFAIVSFLSFKTEAVTAIS